MAGGAWAFSGPAATGGVLDPRHPVYATPAALEIEQLFESAAALARVKPPGFTVRLGLLAAEILALLRWSPRSRGETPRRIDALISESQALLAADLAGKQSLEQIARKLGLGYSYFRRRFKAQTGAIPEAVPDGDAASPGEEFAAELGADGEGDFGAVGV